MHDALDKKYKEFAYANMPIGWAVLRPGAVESFETNKKILLNCRVTP